MANDYSNNAPIDDDDSGMEVDTPPKSEASEQTALIPTEFFHGKELTPGTVCKVKVERVLDGQVQVSYVPHEQESEMVEEPVVDEEMAGYMNS